MYPPIILSNNKIEVIKIDHLKNEIGILIHLKKEELKIPPPSPEEIHKNFQPIVVATFNYFSLEGFLGDEIKMWTTQYTTTLLPIQFLNH